VRVGDRITIGDDEGDVQSINLRTTVVGTNDRISIIVPNSKLISQRLINWSYGDPRARIAIPVGVATDSDVDLVTKTLLLAAEDVDNVLRDPAPKVQFLKSEIGRWIFVCWLDQPPRACTRNFAATSITASKNSFAKPVLKFLSHRLNCVCVRVRSTSTQETNAVSAKSTSNR